jgi:hypothetical protein
LVGGEKRAEKNEKQLVEIGHLIRRATLNQWSKFHDLNLTAIRNNWVHGGNVEADIEVIEIHGSDENNPGVGWRNAFEHAYGVSLDDIRGEDVPIKFYHTLNRQASVIHLHAWKKGPNPEGH